MDRMKSRQHADNFVSIRAARSLCHRERSDRSSAGRAEVGQIVDTPTLEDQLCDIAIQPFRCARQECKVDLRCNDPEPLLLRRIVDWHPCAQQVKGVHLGLAGRRLHGDLATRSFHQAA